MMPKIFSLLLALSFCLPVSAQRNTFDWEESDDNNKTGQTQSTQSTQSVQSRPAAAAESAKEESLSGKVESQGSAVAARAKTPMLFGRIDQIASEANVSFPPLKMETAKLDKSAESKPLQAQVSESRFSGHITSSFPMDFSGNWGGSIKVWRFSTSGASMQEDAAETSKLEKILQPGREGTVNFAFEHSASGGITLEPTVVKMMIPASESYGMSKLAGQMGLTSQMMQMVSSAMSSTQIPVFLHFGEVSTSGNNEVGVSGNQIQQHVVKNEIRQLAPNVIEQQIITRDASEMANGARREGYTESDIRFTQQSSGAMYVLAASVDYGSRGEFLRKLIMYGNVYRGHVMDTSPSSYNLSSMMSQAMGRNGGAGYGMSPQGGSYNNMSQLGNLMNQYGVSSNSGSYPQTGGANMGSYLQGFSQAINSLNAMPNQY
ncbi:MAG: hypothetical protein KIT34_10245 [Cyanobacteria bacterium TGS_CYA1]|nr:hypothetical protein [Cyanobacteria bacterium TGS_CYA1]